MIQFQHKIPDDKSLFFISSSSLIFTSSSYCCVTAGSRSADSTVHIMPGFIGSVFDACHKMCHMNCILIYYAAVKYRLEFHFWTIIIAWSIVSSSNCDHGEFKFDTCRLLMQQQHNDRRRRT